MAILAPTRGPLRNARSRALIYEWEDVVLLNADESPYITAPFDFEIIYYMARSVAPDGSPAWQTRAQINSADPLDLCLLLMNDAGGSTSTVLNPAAFSSGTTNVVQGAFDSAANLRIPAGTLVQWRISTPPASVGALAVLRMTLLPA